MASPWTGHKEHKLRLDLEERLLSCLGVAERSSHLARFLRQRDSLWKQGLRSILAEQSACVSSKPSRCVLGIVVLPRNCLLISWEFSRTTIILLNLYYCTKYTTRHISWIHLFRVPHAAPETPRPRITPSLPAPGLCLKISPASFSKKRTLPWSVKGLSWFIEVGRPRAFTKMAESKVLLLSRGPHFLPHYLWTGKMPAKPSQCDFCDSG
jgi:hypothetical protein